MSTFTQEELDRAVAAATATAVARVAELEAAAAGSQVETKVAEVTAAKDAEIAALQAKVDAAEVASNAAAAGLKAMEDFLKDEAEKEAAAKVVADRRESRKTEVAELVKAGKANWTDEQVEAKLDRWAAMDDGAWTSAKEEWAEMIAGIPAGTRTLSSARETAALRPTGTGATSATSVMEKLRALDDIGIDPRQFTR